MLKIEKGIPMPGSLGKGVAKYPFHKMEIGDSVFFEGKTTSSKEYLAANQCGLRKGFKFTGKSVDGGLRIWRIS